jgi:hypothetical protein
MRKTLKNGEINVNSGFLFPLAGLLFIKTGMLFILAGGLFS